MARKRRRLGRFGIIPAALLIMGVAGIIVSQADASQAASGCDGSGGLLSAATSTLCKTTSTAKKVVDGATGGATSGVTSTVNNTVSSAGSTVNSVTGSSGSSPSPSPSSPGGSTGTSPAGSGGKTSPAPAGSQQSSHSSGAAGRAAPAGSWASGPLAAGYRAAVLATLLRRLGVADGAGTAGAAGFSGAASAGQSSLQLPTVKPSGGAGRSPAGTRLAAASGHTAGAPWLLIAVAATLAGAIGLIYTGWRNADLVFGRRRREPMPVPGRASARYATAAPAHRAPRYSGHPAPGPRPARVDLRARRTSVI